MKLVRPHSFFSVFLLSAVLFFSGCNAKINPGTAGVTVDQSMVVKLRLDSISPSMGSINGGTSIVVKGVGFTGVSSLRVGSASCNNLKVISDSEVRCVTSASSLGTVDVSIAKDQDFTGLSGAFTYVDGIRPTVQLTTNSPNITNAAIQVTATFNLGVRDFDATKITVGNGSVSNFQISSNRIYTFTVTPTADGAVTIQVPERVAQDSDNSFNVASNLLSIIYDKTVPDVTQLSLDPSSPSPNPNPTPVVKFNLVENDQAQVSLYLNACSGAASSAISKPSALLAKGSGSLAINTLSAPGAYPIFAKATDRAGNESPCRSVGTYSYDNSQPLVSSLTPSSGPISGGNSVVVNGSNFKAGAVVSFGGKSASCTLGALTSGAASDMTCTVPQGTKAGDVSVVVTNANALFGSGTYTYLGPPTLSSITPASGRPLGGNTVTLSGTGFLAKPTITIGGVSCGMPSMTSSIAATCIVPANQAGTYPVVLTNSDGQKTSEVVNYTYQAAPTLTSISPDFGSSAGGKVITLTGTGFLPGLSITIGGTSCTNPTLVSATSATCTTPPMTAGSYPVVLTNSDNQRSSQVVNYTYLAAPTLASISPPGGNPAGGATVTLTGTGFVSGLSVMIGGQNCSNAKQISSTSATCTVLAKAAGTYPVVLTNPDNQKSSEVVNYTYQGAPTLTSVSPANGNLSGGALVTLTGTGFLTGLTVTVGGQDCASATQVSTTSATCRVPAMTAGTYPVVLTNPDNQRTSQVVNYTYQGAPTLTSISPAGGGISGRNTVTLTGTGFVSGLTISIGGNDCTNAKQISATSATCTVPANQEGTYPVYLTNSDGQSATLASGYTYRAIALTVKANLLVWLDASDKSTLPTNTNGQPIARWLDKSGGVRHFTQSTSRSQPTLAASSTHQQNGLNGVLFDGVDDFMAGTHGLSAKQELSIFVVWKFVTQPSFGGTSVITIGERTQDQGGVFHSYPFTYNGSYFGYRSPFHDWPVSPKVSAGAGTKNMYVSRLNSTTQTINLNSNFYSRDYISAWNELKITNPAMEFGRSSVASESLAYKNVVLYELLLYGSSLSDADTSAVMTYLNDKWAMY